MYTDIYTHVYVHTYIDWRQSTAAARISVPKCTAHNQLLHFTLAGMMHILSMSYVRTSECFMCRLVYLLCICFSSAVLCARLA